MKALKRIIIVVITVVMLTSLLAIPAAAKPERYQKTNVCAVTCNDIRYQIASGIADAANATIDALVAAAQESENPNIPRLVRQTELISRAAIVAIRALGYDAVCEYVEYEIGGQTVEIDPIIIIKRD